MHRYLHTVSHDSRGGAHRVVVSTAAFHARVRGSFHGLGGLKETVNVSSPPTRKTRKVLWGASVTQS